MRARQIGAHRSYVLEARDTVVVMGQVERHRQLLATIGLEQHPETKEWLGTGSHLYAIDPDTFFRLFSARDTGTTELTAQATDGKDFYQIDALPVVGEDNRITEIYALDLETRTFIEEGVSNFRVG